MTKFRVHSSAFSQCALIAWLLVSAPHISFADDWNYPKPDPGQDVENLSFYVAPVDEARLPQAADMAPRNVILMIGDGMGFNHVALARHRSVGADKRLHMERFPIGGMLRTHSSNSPVTDSAAAATALATGVKTHNGRIGIDAEGKPWQSIMLALRDKGRRTGLVVTSTLSHATPAGFAAHVNHRGMEPQIAAQMIGSRIDVLLGGGRKFWLPSPAGARNDGRNLIDEARAEGYQIARSREELNQLAKPPVLGMFANDALTTFAPEPMLHEMTGSAIRLLTANSDNASKKAGFFLMVEGSQIDWAGHGNDTDNAIRQTLLFDMAVKTALDFALRDKRTLVIVTADHETGGLLLKPNGGRMSATWTTKDHTASDVPIYAFGPGSTRFGGAQDLSDLPKHLARLIGLDDFPSPLEKVPASR